jgi:hypothetical protein
MTSSTEYDHRAEALRLAAATDHWDSSDLEQIPYVMHLLALAQIHATLAVTAQPPANVPYLVIGPDQDEGGLTTLGRPAYDVAEARKEADDMNARWAVHGGGRPWKLCALVEVPDGRQG